MTVGQEDSNMSGKQRKEIHSNSYRNSVFCFQAGEVDNGNKFGKECDLVKSSSDADVSQPFKRYCY